MEVAGLRLYGGYWSSSSVPEPGSDISSPLGVSISSSGAVVQAFDASSGLSVRAVRP